MHGRDGMQDGGRIEWNFFRTIYSFQTTDQVVLVLMFTDTFSFFHPNPTLLIYFRLDSGRVSVWQIQSFVLFIFKNCSLFLYFSISYLKFVESFLLKLRYFPHW
jgi:hypothetical protein